MGTPFSFFAGLGDGRPARDRAVAARLLGLLDQVEIRRLSNFFGTTLRRSARPRVARLSCDYGNDVVVASASDAASAPSLALRACPAVPAKGRVKGHNRARSIASPAQAGVHGSAIKTAPMA